MSRRVKSVRPALIELEPRLVLNGGGLPSALPGPPPAGPISTEQWLGFYGLDNVPARTPGGGYAPATGQGQTIVIVSVARDGSYRNSDDPDWMRSGLAVYSREMGLTTDFSFTMVNQEGDASFQNLPPAAATVDDAREFDLDTQTVHTIAPQANIIVVVANSSSMADRLACFRLALTYRPAVVSMSFSWTESPQADYRAWAFDGGVGTTIVQSAGDAGAGMQFMGGTRGQPTDLQYQPIAAQSPKTVMVGGSYLMPSGGTFIPVAWGEGDLSYLIHTDKSDSDDVTGGGGGGTGGGYSLYEPAPAYQALSPYVQQNVPLFPAAAKGMRLGPDLAMESKPGIEVLTYDPTNHVYLWSEKGSNEADPIGGTSLAAPTFAGAMALVAQARAAAQLPALSSLDTLNFLYQAPRSAFVDITQGDSGYPALPGFDLASGLGSPTAGLWDHLIRASYTTTTTLTALPSVGLLGQTKMLTATVAATGATPTGSVTFLDDGRPIGTATLNAAGQATIPYTPSRVGTRNLSVVYGGQGLFAGSASAPSATEIAAVPTVTTLSISRPQPGRPGLVSFTVTVSSATWYPDGSVNLSINGQLVSTATLDTGGQAISGYRFARQGIYLVSASFVGQAPFANSSTPTLQLRVGRGRLWTRAWGPAAKLPFATYHAHRRE